MSLEERTLVIRNLHSQRVSKPLLQELFTQAGPVVNVVLRADFAFVEFEHRASVGYSLALMDGVCLFGKALHLEPRVRHDQTFYTYLDALHRFNHVMRDNPDFFAPFLTDDSSRRQPDPHPHPHHRQPDQHRQSSRRSNSQDHFGHHSHQHYQSGDERRRHWNRYQK